MTLTTGEVKVSLPESANPYLGNQKLAGKLDRNRGQPESLSEKTIPEPGINNLQALDYL